MRTIITSPAFCSGARRFAAPLTLMVLLGAGLPAGAQTESFILKPGSKVGPATKVKATDCVTQPDGTVTCNTKLVNPSGDTPAKPSYSPFKN
jgi:hypothetical protein